MRKCLIFCLLIFNVRLVFKKPAGERDRNGWFASVGLRFVGCSLQSEYIGGRKKRLFTRLKTLSLIFLLTSICHISSFILIGTPVFSSVKRGFNYYSSTPGRGTLSPNTSLPCDSLALCAEDFHHDFVCLGVCAFVRVPCFYLSHTFSCTSYGLECVRVYNQNLGWPEECLVGTFSVSI